MSERICRTPSRSPSRTPQKEQSKTAPVPPSKSQSVNSSQSSKTCVSCGEERDIKKFKTNGPKGDGTTYRMATCRYCMESGKKGTTSEPTAAPVVTKSDILLELTRAQMLVSNNMTKLADKIGYV